MYYEIWIDILFLVNAWIDFLLLRFVNHLLRGTATPIRSMLGACIGASVVCCLACFPGTPIVNTLLVHVVGNTIMIRFGCNLKSIKKTGAGVLLLYGASFCMGGILQFLQRYVGEISTERVIFYGMLAYALMTVCTQGYHRYLLRQKNTYHVWLYVDGKCKKTEGFLDTGNHLCDPLSGKPVCIVKSTILEGLCSQTSIEQLRNFQDGVKWEEEVRKLRPHYIPFCTLGCTDKTVLALTLDFICLENQNTQKIIARPVLAIAGEDGSFLGKYQMILHPNLIDS